MSDDVDPRNSPPVLRGRIEELEGTLQEIMQHCEAFPREWRNWPVQRVIDQIHNIARDALYGTRRSLPTGD